MRASALAALFCVALVAASVPVGAVAGAELRITKTYGLEAQPDIHGTRVVWADSSQSGEKQDIWMYDLATGDYRQISHALLDEQWPQVFYPWIAWTEWVIVEDPIFGTRTLRTIMVHDLRSGETHQVKDLAVSGFPAGEQLTVSLYGETLVWQNQDADGAMDIFAMNVASGTVTQVTNDPKVQQLPTVFGSWVAYEEFTGDVSEQNRDIVVYNLQTPTATARVAARPSWDETEPTIYGDTLVYTDYRDDPDRRLTFDDPTLDAADLYMVDLSPLLSGSNLSAPQPLVVAPGSQEEPHLFGDRLVWRDFRANASEADLWTMEMGARQPELLVGTPGDLWEISIWDDVVVWSDWRNDANVDDEIDDFDIYAWCFNAAKCAAPPPRTPVLLYAAVGLAVVVTAAAGVYFLVLRRPRVVPEGRRGAPSRSEEPEGKRPAKGKGPRPKA